MPRSDSSAATPALVPINDASRVMLYAVRRMAIAGINDAQAQNHLFNCFGRRHRQPLMLLRALVVETARASRRKIKLAPCCCRRMTDDEALLLTAVASAGGNVAGARDALNVLLDCGPQSLPVLGCAQAISQCFADLMMPFEPLDTSQD